MTKLPVDRHQLNLTRSSDPKKHELLCCENITEGSQALTSTGVNMLFISGLVSLHVTGSERLFSVLKGL